MVRPGSGPFIRSQPSPVAVPHHTPARARTPPPTSLPLRFAALRKVKIRKRITEACKKVTLCPWCGAINGPVKRVPGAQAFKLIHDKYGRDYR